MRLKNNRKRSNLTKAIHTLEQPDQPWSQEAYSLTSTAHAHKVALRMDTQKRNSTKPLEKAGKMHHLVRIRFILGYQEPSRRRQDRPLHYLPRKLRQRLHSTTLTRPACALSIKKASTKATFHNTDKTGLCTIYQDSFDKGYIPQHWQDRPLHYLPRKLRQRLHSTTLTRPAFALSTKKALTKATFHNTDKTGLYTIYQEIFDKGYIAGHWTDVASWKLIPNKRRTTASWRHTASSQHRPPLLPWNSPDILPLNRKGETKQKNAHGKMQLHLHTMCPNESIGKNTKCMWQSRMLSCHPFRNVLF